MAFRQRIHESWLLRLLAWDCLLPASVAVAPILVKLVLPNRPGAIEILGLTLPITAFFLRVRAGKRHIFSNRCSTITQKFQFCVFCVAILPLILFECFIILGHAMPQVEMSDEDLRVWLIMGAIYLSLMTVAMYPGRAKRPPFVPTPETVVDAWWEREGGSSGG